MCITGNEMLKAGISEGDQTPSKEVLIWNMTFTGANVHKEQSE